MLEHYPKWFIKAALIYLGLGIILGMAMGMFPYMSIRIRFVHIHINLLGFMTMFISGVAYHVLPRFSGRNVPWLAGVKYHFWLHNLGLPVLLASHLAGGYYVTGLFRVTFILGAVMTAVGLFMMIYNLYKIFEVPAG